jgi:hypothetical protein
MVIAPLTASAEVADATVVTEQAQPGAVAAENETAAIANATDVGEFSHGPGYVVDDADIVYGESESTGVTYVVNGIYDDSVVGNASEETAVEDEDFSPGPDWYVADDVDVVHDESEDTAVTYVVNGIHNDTVIGNHSEETTVVEGDDDGFSPGPDWYVADDVDIVHSESEDTAVTYVVNGIHDNTVIGNYAEDNTYVGDGVDEYEVVHDDDYVHDDYVDDYTDSDDYAGVDEECDDSTSTYYEELSAGAGNDGAYVHSVESGSFELD